MSADLSFFSLIAGASVVVQLVMLLLLTVSVLSWAMIFRKRSALHEARTDADRFEERFWSGGDLYSLYNQISPRSENLRGLANIFVAGFQEFTRLRKKAGADPTSVVEGAQRSMRVSLAREVDDLETHLSFLATVGSTSPYVGLFGTVWGIMNSFSAIGAKGSATLAVVAPGIAEALIATAMGLFAAIPAVVAYNRYSHDVERLNGRYEDFMDEFTTILQRQAHAPVIAKTITAGAEYQRVVLVSDGCQKRAACCYCHAHQERVRAQLEPRGDRFAVRGVTRDIRGVAVRELVRPAAFSQDHVAEILERAQPGHGGGRGRAGGRADSHTCA